MGFNFATRAESVVVTVRSAITPRQVLVRSLGLCTRAALEAIGLVSVVVVLVLAVAPALRAPAQEAALAVWTAVCGRPAADAEDVAEDDSGRRQTDTTATDLTSTFSDDLVHLAPSSTSASEAALASHTPTTGASAATVVDHTASNIFWHDQSE